MSGSCKEDRLLSPAAASRDLRTSSRGDSIAFFPYSAPPDECLEMRAFYDGSWRSTTKDGLTMRVSTTVDTLKVFGGLGVYEYDGIPSRNVGMQLFGYGPTVATALAVDRAIVSTAGLRVAALAD
jgi:hypothetical protein